MRAVPSMVVFCSSLFLSRLIAQICSKRFWGGQVLPVLYLVSLLFFTYHVRCISLVISLYFRIFSDSFLTAFLSREITTSSNMHVPFSLSPIMMSSLLLEMALSVCSF